MRLSRAIVFALVLLLAGTASAMERVDIPIRLVLVDQCTIDAGERSRTESVVVNCSSEQPYRLDALPGDGYGPIAAAHMIASDEHPRRPRLTISF